MLLLLAVMWAVFAVQVRAESEQAAYKNFIITEIMFDPEGNNREHTKWIELYNTGDDFVFTASTAAQYYVCDSLNASKNCTKHSLHIDMPTLEFKKGDYLLVAAKPDQFDADYGEASVSIIKSALGITSTDKSFVKLCFVDDTTCGESVEYGGFGFDLKSMEGYSIEKKNKKEKNTPDNWQQCAEVGGTPGEENSSGYVKAPSEQDPQAITMGKLSMDKNIYLNTYGNFKIEKNSDEKVTWDFGDGHKSYLAKTRHKYAALGTYAASVKVYKGKNNAVQQFSVEVKKYPHPKIQIIEVKANPKGKDSEGETITVLNKSKKTLNLKGWSIATGAKKKLINHPIKTDVKIKKKKTKVITKEMSKFSLNNKKGKIELRYPDGKVASKAKYDHGKVSIADDEIYQKVKGGWEWVGGTQDTITKQQDTNNIQEPIINNQTDENAEPDALPLERKTSNLETQASMTLVPIEIHVPKYKIELAVARLDSQGGFLVDARRANISAQPHVLGAQTVREDDGQYLFTPPSQQQPHYAVTFFERIISFCNSSFNLLLNKIF